ncbi:MAG: hypothetical protein WD046_08380 [Paracoccaceae bacterium]
MANDNVIPVKVTIDPLTELDKKKLALLMVKEIGYKKPKAMSFSQDFKPTSAKWNKKTIEAQMRVVARYDLSLFATQLMEIYGYIEKAKNGQDKMKATKAFEKKAPALLKSLEGRIAEKIEDLCTELSSEAKFNEKALTEASKALDPKGAESFMTLIEDAGDEMRNFLLTMEDERDEMKKKNEPEDKISKALKLSAASFKTLTRDFTSNALGKVKEVQDMQKSFSGALKAGVADAEAKDAKTATTAIKNEVMRLGNAAKVVIADHTTALALVTKGEAGSKTAKLIVSKNTPLFKSAQAIVDLAGKLEATYKKKAKAAKP